MATGSVVTTGTGVPQGTTTHPLYTELAPTWRKLAYVYLGSGGFRDGTALIPHPREWKDYDQPTPTQPTRKLLNRRAIACYENIARHLVDLKVSAIFRENVTREIGGKGRKDADHPLWAWWDNVDGRGCHISDYMAESTTAAFVFGHVTHLMDLPAGEPAETKADEPSPYLRPYLPLDMPDWLIDDRGQLVAVKLLEAVPRTDLSASADSNQSRERIVTEADWQVVEKGSSAGGGQHTFGRLPVVVHYARRLPMVPVVGASELGDPNLYYDLYNLTSEIRELLRAQTFGVLNIELGTGQNATSADDARQMLGSEKGVENVMFSPGRAQYLQPDTGNVQVYQQERMERRREIYRQSFTPWESDSRDAEAEGSLKLKREDLNQRLAVLADEIEKAEYQFVELWFRNEYGPERWKAEYDKAQVVIRYPETFDITPFSEVLEQAQAATALDMPPEVDAAVKKRLLQKFLPDLPSAEQARLEKAIEDYAKKSAQESEQRKKLEMAALGAAPFQPGVQP